MDIINKYFPDLTYPQKESFGLLEDIYSDWNSRINLISRKDFEHFYERHVLHSLGIAKVIQFTNKSSILDVGTGGGFPGIPLAILFPEVNFHLIDSIGKKTKVVYDIATQLDLDNVAVQQIRAEELKGKFDFIVSRAVTSLPDFHKWVTHLISKKNNNPLPNGILYLKGGDFVEELKSLKSKYEVYDLNKYFKEGFFETKKLVHIY
ncbi:MAG: 16S rRNA (guanine(527)-N(7))-methyltransferase RsmG [Bacteroidales bacterium]